MSTVVVRCIDVKRNKNGEITHCVLCDDYRNIKVFTSNEVKDILKTERMHILNMSMYNGELIEV